LREYNKLQSTFHPDYFLAADAYNRLFCSSFSSLASPLIV
jgi:hypothetical protein